MVKALVGTQVLTTTIRGADTEKNSRLDIFLVLPDGPGSLPLKDLSCRCEIHKVSEELAPTIPTDNGARAYAASWVIWASSLSTL